MDIETLRDYVLQKMDVTEGFPFGDSVMVFKVKGKMFLLVQMDDQPLRFNAKCDPERAIELREQYPTAILPGYHMNKLHWNTVIADGSLHKKLLLEMVDDSYELVKASVKKKK